MEFSEKSVMITGAAGNLGRAVAEAFFAQGAKCSLIDVDGAKLKEAFGSDGDHRILLPIDLSKPSAIEEAVDQAWITFGQIDVLCNLAGGFAMGKRVHETTADLWQGMMDLNANTVLNMARAVAPRMMRLRRGKIINVGAMAALRGGAAMGAYAASKSAVIRLTESMSAELKESGINVNCVLPSIIDTQANREAMPDADPARWVAPEALAEVILFLASDRARAIHGAAVPVTGLS